LDQNETEPMRKVNQRIFNYSGSGQNIVYSHSLYNLYEENDSPPPPSPVHIEDTKRKDWSTSKESIDKFDLIF